MTVDILFVYPHPSSFIERDLSLLRERHSVATVRYDRRRSLAPLLRRLPRARISFSWFCLGYAYPLVRIGRWLGVPSVLVAGGWDVESRPDLEYGAMLSAKRKRRTGYALAHADRVLAVSAFTMRKVQSWAPSAAVDVVCQGFPPTSIDSTEPREDRVVTAAPVRRGTWKLKGLDTFLAVAASMPDVSFVVAGKVHEDPDKLGGKVPPNVRFLGWLEPDALHRLFRSSKVYAQLSAVESFGCVLAEAMSWGCHPVATDRGALPEVVGDAGTLVPYGDVEATTEVVRRALDGNGSDVVARRIRDRFPLETRRSRLHAVVDALFEEA